MLQQNTRALSAGGSGRSWKRDERVRLDVLPGLDLGTAKETSDIGLHVGRSDVEHIDAKRARSFARQLIGQDAECDGGELRLASAAPAPTRLLLARKPDPSSCSSEDEERPNAR